MSLYGFNRSALNGGVSGIIAGAALVIAVSGFVADGTRVVLPSAETVVVSTAQSTAVRTTYGDGDFVAVSSGTAWPALFQLQSADIVVASSLSATYTDAWRHVLGGLTGEGFITRPGAGALAGVATVSATPLVTAGFASKIIAVSTTTADASVTLNGQSTVQRDGYVQRMDVSSATTASALRTALGYAIAETSSDCIADGSKTHGGRAVMDAVWSVSAIASTDAAFIVANSALTANAVLTHYGQCLSVWEVAITAAPINTKSAEQVNFVGASVMAGDARIALLGSASITGSSGATATGTRRLMGESTVECLASISADARLALLGEAVSEGVFTSSALGGLFLLATADMPSLFTVTAFAVTNAESPDPVERTMYRIATDRTMYRPFTDREMRRSA